MGNISSRQFGTAPVPMPTKPPGGSFGSMGSSGMKSVPMPTKPPSGSFGSMGSSGTRSVPMPTKPPGGSFGSGFSGPKPVQNTKVFGR